MAAGRGIQRVKLGSGDEPPGSDLGTRGAKQIAQHGTLRVAGLVDVGASLDPDLSQARGAEQVGQPAAELGVGAVVPVSGHQQLGDPVHGCMRRVAQAFDVGLECPPRLRPRPPRSFGASSLATSAATANVCPGSRASAAVAGAGR